MAKKDIEERDTKQENSRRRFSFSKFCAFWGIALAATLFLVNGILKMVNEVFEVQSQGMYNCMSALDFISKLALLVAVGIPAYGYVSNKKLGWKIAYIVAIVFYAGFCVYHLF